MPLDQSRAAAVGGGVLSGLTLTFALNRVVAQWAQGNSNDPMILIEATLLFVLVAGIASAIPALRAAQVSPMTALRCE
ncbi:hypothetical protein B4Q13_22850 [Lacticaseibacillus rhamnosus]